MALGLVIRGAQALSESLNRTYRVLKGVDPDSVWLRLPSGGSFEVRHSVTGVPVFSVTDNGTVVSVGSEDIADGAITSAKIADGTIQTGDLADGAVTSAKIADGTIQTLDLADGAVTSAKLADSTIVNADVSPTAAIQVTKIDHVGANNVLRSNGTTNVGGQVATGDLADQAVTSAKIADSTIVNADIAAAGTANIAVAKLAHVGANNVLKSSGTANVGGQVLDADIAPTAAIDGAKVATNSIPADRIIGGIVAPPSSEAVNPIINGEFLVWQRGTTFASIANATYTADRWVWANSTTAVFDVSRSSDVPPVSSTVPFSTFSLLADCQVADTSVAAGDLVNVSQRIEGYNFLPIAQREFTLSFWVKATKTGTYCVAFRNRVGDRSFVSEYTVTAPDTWEYKTLIVAASPSAGGWSYDHLSGLNVDWILMAGSTYQTTPGSWATGNYYATASQVNACDSTANSFRLAQVRITPGTAAAPFQPRPFSGVVLLAQRYYWKTFPYAEAPRQASGVFVGFVSGRVQVAGAGGRVDAHVRFPTVMRTTPTATSYNPSLATSTWRNMSTGAESGTPGVNFVGDAACEFTTSQVAGDAYGQVLGVHADFSAEL